MNDNEKQVIEEMALIICGFKDCTSCISRMGLRKCGAKAYAERFYNAGYRKQSEGIANNATTTGEWRWISDDCVMCNRCGKTFDSDDYADAWTFNFCPECGAKMKGATDE